MICYLNLAEVLDLHFRVIESSGGSHPFVDGNKRLGHAAMESFLVLNGFEISCPADEQEQVILAVAASSMKREDFTAWVQGHVQPRRKEL